MLLCAALVLLTEPVFAAVISYATGERLATAAVVGAVLILAGAALAELSAAVASRVSEPGTAA